jgi:hypothetical protein
VSETSKVPYMPGKTVDKVIQHLNTLCRPIAHFSPLAQSLSPGQDSPAQTGG